MLFNSIIAAALGLALAAFYANKVLSIKVTDEKVEELSASIREGSMAFLKRMYSWISVFVVVLAVLISTLTEWGYPWGSIAFVAGAFLSSLAGFIENSYSCQWKNNRSCKRWWNTKSITSSF